ncbi:tRNA uridine-5-carboxymethylaminomethyl(34) synthesis GTPase MnmE [Chryseobacterium indologenes]|uniref:tRNA uridine-5-carboxymethylaminomethyl(34) synthesis GTPase MnmE n=1 Tax=Chryseobacterium indologenes TaxID=253 RepID=UPI000F5167C5|nr:tRNA uridine-5-carboxymethylaminomethyl(34) synthesis GTPase MnmE [Chryseobacterium indologenes]AYZ34951.1 tRNA uridine-5-carboxymethylaminomethyl(34) synthesis GTPase MnmE [Chryseobacterium indologenes]MBF6643693.1 tRNA uridine-5-carboxymethylaminomethyl(34) synthesis GTPase MnmE [Chryseobacterium indologenes]MBU3050532.1 tRNA uridine-5-carboxymethylaminomethyl(34) synthesis GTPase MnmE [Chryseobacterium indologenes]MEB4761600.1 tRNA uridine-5-carboxymethylaminomethyl(34) synthesis GTPase M
MNNDTICALATANGIGALGIIRVSGNEALPIVQKSFPAKKLEKQKSHTIHYGFFMDGEEAIDEVMLSIFLAPKSFTTENSVEIAFHGSPHIGKRILETLIKNGARMAKAGEFTLRAFINGRIDLSQAEAIADVIASENEASRKVAINQLKGGITNEISLLRTDLLNFVSLIELELDFAEEDVEFADRTALSGLLDKIDVKLVSLIESFQYGNAIKNGTAVAIIGKPNAGKSTLLNALLKEERAIVSNIAGTTRDTIEEVLHIKGHAFRLIDTAGLRETVDEIEAIGVKKAKEKVENANILVYLADAATEDFSEDIDMIQSLLREDLKLIICATKIDEVSPAKYETVEDIFRNAISQEFDFIKISAVENQNMQDLKNELSSYVEQLKSEENNVVITNQRHFEALQKSLDAVNKVKEAISFQISTELLAYELRNALEHLGEISGEVTNDEVLGNIFSKFCIGK